MTFIAALRTQDLMIALIIDEHITYQVNYDLLDVNSNRFSVKIAKDDFNKYEGIALSEEQFKLNFKMFVNRGNVRRFGVRNEEI